MIRTFKLSEKDNGKTFIIRFIPNISDIENNIITFTPKNETGTTRYICLAVVNGTFKLLNFGHGIYRQIENKMFLLESDMALKVKVGEQMVNEYEIVKDDVFAFSTLKDKSELQKFLNKEGDIDLKDFIKREENRK